MPGGSSLLFSKRHLITLCSISIIFINLGSLSSLNAKMALAVMLVQLCTAEMQL